MILTYYGHSMFTMTLENGKTILTDPYGDFYQYPKQRLAADVITVSHHHHDHDAVETAEGHPQVFDQAGVFVPASDIILTAIPSKHDSANGTQRGDNLIFVIEAEGLKMVHMGDIGHRLTARQRMSIGTPDVLMIPVGGYYTIDAAVAADTVRLLRPRVTIPMHYRTIYNADMPITDEKPFLSLMNAQPTPMPVCRLSYGDMSERPDVILLDITATSAA